jgi:hypothetical protein
VARKYDSGGWKGNASAAVGSTPARSSEEPALRLVYRISRFINVTQLVIYTDLEKLVEIMLFVQQITSAGPQRIG